MTADYGFLSLIPDNPAKKDSNKIESVDCLINRSQLNTIQTIL
jgi:hypothetical protein